MRGSEPPSRQRCSSLLVPSGAGGDDHAARACSVRAPRPQPGSPERSLVDRVAVGAVGGAERADLGHRALGRSPRRRSFSANQR